MDEKSARAHLLSIKDKLPDGGIDILADWERIRGLIEHEDNLINQRITWLISINAFLFTGYFLSQRPGQAAFNELASYLLWAIPFFGVAVSYSIKSGVKAAMNQIRWINDWWVWRKSLDPKNHAESPDDSLSLRHPRLTGLTPSKSFDHDFMISDALPLSLIFAWVAILISLSWKTLNSSISFELPIWLGALATVLVPIMIAVVRKNKQIADK